jgi:16S rRNA (cytosine1402-N4)-methyltransferase
VHIPVMVAAATDLLVWDPAGLYVDATLGRGGHFRAFLEKLSPEGRLWGFDWDGELLDRTRALFADAGERVRFFHAPFSRIGVELERAGETAHGIFVDLGLSSDALNDPQRGLQYRDPNAPLDMRMDRTRPLTAAAVVAESSEEELARIFQDLGETRRPLAAARAIVRERGTRPILTAGDLISVLRRARAIPGGPAELSRIFQSLRYVVNDELEELDRLLDHAPEWLVPGGRLVVISYESLTDRRVKSRCRSAAPAGTPALRMLNRHVLRPDREEIRANPRARSAKLRAIERTAAPWQA